MLVHARCNRNKRLITRSNSSSTTILSLNLKINRSSIYFNTKKQKNSLFDENLVVRGLARAETPKSRITIEVGPNHALLRTLHALDHRGLKTERRVRPGNDPSAVARSSKTLDMVIESTSPAQLWRHLLLLLLL